MSTSGRLSAMSPASKTKGAPPDTRDVPCLFCRVEDELIRFQDDPYRVVECRKCGLVYVNPRLSSKRLHEMYQEEYWESERARDFGYTEYLADKKLYERTYRRRSSIIGHHLKTPGHVLDVGCAAGFFLSVMREQNWEISGVEIAKPMVEYAATTLDLPNIVEGDLLSVEVPPKTYDLITLWDVIEHLEDPIAHLRKAHDLLKDDGCLILETQNVASLFARVMGRKWQHYKHEEHLFHFDPRSLARLLEESGFIMAENTSRQAGKYVSMGFIVERLERIHKVLSRLASPLLLLKNLSLYINLQDEMIVVARKR
ncbi:MAG: class I SAM-dependent methyltransferase [Planctomycetota bacterium]|nr:class I SAM-dependent methyltransferase [Planctomycetota bacterium]